MADEFAISRPTLREALHILEMEYLLDLRTGDRAGARIRTPSTRVAAQLSGTVLEARHTTVADCLRAIRLIEPPIAGLIGSRASKRQLTALHEVEAQLAAATEDTPWFIMSWREAERITFSAVKNPALTVIAEILHWIRVGLEPAITADVAGLPWVHKTNRKVQRLFAQFVSAAAEHDSARASQAWAECVQVNEVWTEESEFGKRLMLDLMD